MRQRVTADVGRVLKFFSATVHQRRSMRAVTPDASAASCKNDAGADFAGRSEAQALYLQFWDVPLAGTGARASTMPRASGRRASVCR
ncbi:MAG TPA: hypothetical protein VGU45_02355 [Microvirga sp.]|jgi:hypothetical protein|nr:hypothetical protein [Microvirga sp.]